MAAGFLAGILAASYKVPPGVVAAVLIFSGGVAARMFCGSRTESRAVSARLLFRFFLILAAAGAGWQRYDSQEQFRARYLPYIEDGCRVQVQGRLAKKEFRRRQYVYELTSCVLLQSGTQERQTDHFRQEQSRTGISVPFKIPVQCNRILVYSDSDTGSIGEILVTEGIAETWESAGNEGNFDAQSFYLARKTDFKLREARIRRVRGTKSRWREALRRLRLSVREVYIRVMGEQTGGILAAMALGDKEYLKEEIKELYQKTGLSHILAVSGLHISVIGLSVYGILRRGGRGYYCAGFLSSGLICAYAVMAGMGTPVKRSAGMFFLMLLAQALGRSYDTLNALGILACVLLWENPYLFRDSGFVYSFAAVAGVVWVGNPGRRERRRWGKLRRTLFTSAAIQLVTLPLAAWYSGEIPVCALPVNLLVLPFTGLILACGLCGGLAGTVYPSSAPWLLFLCGKLLELTVGICRFFAGFPWAVQITGRPEPARMIVYYAGLAAVTMYCHGGGRGSRTGHGRGCCREKRAPALLPAGIALLFFLFFPARGGFELDVLDVGQGDGSFLRTGEGITLFVDGGSSSVGEAGTRRILPFLKAKGARGIGFWFVSHVDEDHISGLREVLNTGYRISHLIFSAEIPREEKQRELEELAAEHGTKVMYVSAGDTLHLGKADVHVLFPLDKSAGQDRNAASLVFLYREEDFLGIFTGDIGEAEERKILASLHSREGIPEKADFYKAAHHGSDGSGSAEFLKRFSPAVSVVSCSRTNRYGHPGEAALRRMREAGSRVYMTMEGGRVRIRRRGGKLVVEPYRPTESGL